MEPAEPLKSPPRVVEMGTASKPSAPHLSDHLANERTYLAYLRTSIALIGFGITINRFSIYLVQSKTLPERILSRWNLGGISRVGFGLVIFGLIHLGLGDHSLHPSQSRDRTWNLPSERNPTLDHHVDCASRRRAQPDLAVSALGVPLTAHSKRRPHSQDGWNLLPAFQATSRNRSCSASLPLRPKNMYFS
jgi:uncharacterized membrane protein YidH (DUF202 family)